MKQTILTSTIRSKWDSFHLMSCTLFFESLGKCYGNAGGLDSAFVRTQDLVLQHGHKLALERVHLTVAHTLLITHTVEAHFVVEGIGNQTEHPEVEGMHVQAQVFHPERRVAVAE